jgi:hypothetical protein
MPGGNDAAGMLGPRRGKQRNPLGAPKHALKAAARLESSGHPGVSRHALHDHGGRPNRHRPGGEAWRGRCVGVGPDYAGAGSQPERIGPIAQ